MQGYNEGLAMSASSSYNDYSDVAFDLSPDGNRLAFAGKGVEDSRDLYLLNLKTLEVTLVAQTDKEEADPSFSNDGKSLLYSASEYEEKGYQIYQRTLDRKSVKRLTSTPNRSDAFGRFSPDGSQIVFVRGHRYVDDGAGSFSWADWDVYVMRKDGSQLRRITRQNSLSISPPHFGPDGKTIFYSTVTGADDSLWKSFSIKLGRGHKPKVLTDVRRGAKEIYAAGSDPALSPDRKRMVFVSDRSEAYEYELYTSDLTGARAKRVSWHRAYINTPLFSKDGRQIYYLLDHDFSDQFELWRTDVSGKNARRIADERLFSHPLRWRKKS